VLSPFEKRRRRNTTGTIGLRPFRRRRNSTGKIVLSPFEKRRTRN
jgi:hypothetical protein